MEMDLKAQQALAKVRDMYAAGQWSQGQFVEWNLNGEEVDAKFCPVGGVRFVLTGADDPADVWEDELAKSQPYWQALTALAMEIDPDKTASIITSFDDTDPDKLALAMVSLEGVVTVWNDSAERELEEVIAIIDQALAKA